ncbi:hypothetical protein Hdeb2414_s0013g00406231 [Helianthus debilis subsp. tardiflorus]
MIFKIENPAYVASENDAWRHDNSNSEDETDRLRDMVEKKLRYWFVREGKRKRTPKSSPAVSAPKVVTPRIIIKGIVERGSRPSQESQPRLEDELVLNPADIPKAGVDLPKVIFEQYVNLTEDVTQTQADKENQAEDVVYEESGDADNESTETEAEIERIGVGKG